MNDAVVVPTGATASDVCAAAGALEVTGVAATFVRVEVARTTTNRVFNASDRALLCLSLVARTHLWRSQSNWS